MSWDKLDKSSIIGGQNHGFEWNFMGFDGISWRYPLVNTHQKQTGTSAFS